MTRPRSSPSTAATSDARSTELSLSLTGMHCTNCAQTIERALGELPGVLEASVNFATERAEVRLVRGEAGPVAAPAELVSVVEGLGFGVLDEVAGDADELARDTVEIRGRAEELFRQVRLLRAAAALTLPLFALSMGRDFGVVGVWAHAPWVNLLLFSLALPVQILLGRAHFVGGWRSLKHGTANMDVLVALGSTVAFGYSVVVAVVLAVGSSAAGTHVYFETAALILLLVRVGRVLELRARRETGRAVSELLRLRPETARVVGRDGTESEVGVETLRVGDLVSVRPGERVAVDGIIVEGASSIDASAVTGEPLPVDCGVGDEVTGGTINLFGAFRFRVEAVGRDTALAKIVAAVRQAQASRAPIQMMVDRVAAVFVPVVLAVAMVTLSAWWIASDAGIAAALVRSVAVLVVACPCAMGLATPTAVTVATGRGAQLGILYRNAAALEVTRDIRHVVLDKTGTVTSGKPRVLEVSALDGNEDALLAVAASAESASEHPLARAVVAAAEERGIETAALEAFRAHPGMGVVATLPRGEAVVGSVRFLESEGVSCSPLTRAVEAAEAAGRGVVCVAIDGVARGLVTVGDSIAPGSKEAVGELFRQGLGTTLLTGDAEAPARRVAEAVGIEDVAAELLPRDKAERIEALRRSHGAVAMVGDGINDAPALATADLGVAMGSGADIAVESADLTLVRHDLRSLADALALGRATVRAIRQNLFWAFSYNVALIPLAAGVLYPFEQLPDPLRALHPAFAAGAMAVSSLCVVGNSLRLRALRLRQR